MIHPALNLPTQIVDIIEDETKSEMLERSVLLKLCPTLMIFKITYFVIPIATMGMLPKTQIVLTFLILGLSPLITIYCLFKYRYSTNWFNFTGHLISDVAILVFIIAALVMESQSYEDPEDSKPYWKSLLVLAITSIAAETVISVVSMIVSLYDLGITIKQYFLNRGL
jgi:hypothetical protein